jgi:hypothetical protein
MIALVSSVLASALSGMISAAPSGKCEAEEGSAAEVVSQLAKRLQTLGISSSAEGKEGRVVGEEGLNDTLHRWASLHWACQAKDGGNRTGAAASYAEVGGLLLFHLRPLSRNQIPSLWTSQNPGQPRSANLSLHHRIQAPCTYAGSPVGP